jgi:hypothetical protein
MAAGDNGTVAIEAVAPQVLAILTRAESLFAADAAGAGAPSSRVGAAAETARAIATRTAELAGAAVRGHGEMITASVDRLERASDADDHLAENLRGTAQFHDAGRSQAAVLRAAAEDVPGQLRPWSQLPAAEAAGLKTLRSQLAGMQRLLARHSAAGARVAAEISTLRYRPTETKP